MNRRMLVMAAFAVTVGVLPAHAQTSASYKLTETTVNNGGNPGAAGDLGSAHFRITLDAIGDGLVGSGATSASYHMDAGFVGGYGPPDEISGLRFPNKTTLVWNPEPWAHRYEVYRGTIASLPGTFGSCFANDLAVPTTSDVSSPSAGQGNFYLVTARNRLREEGPKGFMSNGTEESNPTPCP